MATLPITILTSIFNPYSIDAGESAGIIEFDLLLSENHNRSNTVTTHPVENGSYITDHIKNELEQGALSGMVSSHSIRFRTFTTFGEIVQNSLNFLDAEQRAFDILDKIWRARVPVTITTKMKVYRDVAITNLTTNQSESDGRSITFNVSFQQLRNISLKRISIEADIEIGELDNDLSKQAAPLENAGRQ